MEIRTKEVRLVGDKGEQLGIFTPVSGSGGGKKS